jgi:hypothetical protein
MATHDRKQWICSSCEEKVQFNATFYDRVKELAEKEWNDMAPLEKGDWRDKVQAEGLYPTIIAETGVAHLCEVKSVREELEQLKLSNKKLWEAIESLKKQIKELSGPQKIK